jgi:Gpi18-like mannosyltransferase
MVRAFAPSIGLQHRPEIAGAILSACLFICFCLIQAELVSKAQERLQWLTPATAGGWIFFLFSPASYIFHTNHTESLFLILSFSAFWSAWRRHWKRAALLAGLCALTRHQGILVAVAIALYVALEQKDWLNRISIFLRSGLISFLLFSLYPLYQYFETGSPFTFLRIRAQLHSVDSVYGWIGTLWYANPWQTPNWRDHVHLLFFFLLCGAAAYLITKKQYALALYTFLSTIVVLFQGETVDMFRYGCVLFPALFVLGDLVMRLPRPFPWFILSIVVLFNLIYTRAYALGEWAY